MITEADLNWLAGIMDFAGSMGLYPCRGEMVPQFTISGPGETMEVLGAMLGANVKVMRRVNGVRYKAQIGAGRAYVVIWNVRPYLRARAEQAQVILDGSPTFPRGGRANADMVSKMSALGWYIP